MNKKFFECYCKGEGITIDTWADERLMILAMWNYYNNCVKLSFIDRVKWAWHMIRKGETFGDEIMLDKKTALELGKSIIAHAEKLNNK